MTKTNGSTPPGEQQLLGPGSSSASGPRLVIQDPYNNQSLGTTDDSLGTTGWRQQVVDFVTGPEARLITVRVMRVPGNPLIKGTFWLDDVQLGTVSTSGKID